jgi:hypothetical protein
VPCSRCAQRRRACPSQRNAITPCSIACATSSRMPTQEGMPSHHAHSRARRHRTCPPERNAITPCPKVCGTWSSVEAGGPPIGCNVKRESRAFLDEFSACLVAGGEPAPRQRSLAPLRFLSRRRLTARPAPSPCFSLGSGTLGPPRRVKAARGPSLIGARSACFPRPIARSSWP